MRSFSKAEAFLERHGGPLVVKPTSGSGGGRGVTTGITSIKALKRASRLAARFDTDLLVEEQLAGDSYRLLYLDGEFIDAVRRDPPTVTGDGRHTIRQLIRIENARRLKQRPITALSPLRIDRDCINKLQSMGLSPGSKLKKGRTIVVKQTANENCALRNHSIKDQVHPEIIALGGQLVKDLGVRFAGLDLICNDITMPLSESNGIFNEVNTTPGIHHHYLVSDSAKGVPVAELVLEHMFANCYGVMVLGSRLP
jgi:cyanophycin synthetase